MSPMTLVRSAALPLAPLTACLARLNRHVAAIEAAHSRHARFAALGQDASRDLGLPDEVLMDAPAWEPALPFFMQPRARD